ncbi:phosphonopyruvate decarboxylase [Bartonella sp. AA2SXKL]|uniref:phosphonopyruvate decarboxylase n=1 Tax=Bartonella sp. AA2SXKL TaxID=3243432 RepID=UPI0035D0FD9F
MSKFIEHGISFFAGVPDSVLNEFCQNCLYLPQDQHVIAANEGSAIGLAIGHYLATGVPAVVYMQNSGLGNAINPILSMAHGSCYSIPIILLIGWRGMPETADEPQHRKTGVITQELLTLLDIEYAVLEEGNELTSIKKAVSVTHNGRSFAILVPPSSSKEKMKRTASESPMSRLDSLKVIFEYADKNDLFVASTGYTAREVLLCMSERKMNTDNLLMITGAMGHTSQVAWGIANQLRHKRVWCLEGDGSYLMHLGGATTIATRNTNNLIHVVLNNGLHSSVGNSPITAHKLTLSNIAKAFNIDDSIRIETKKDLIDVLQSMHLPRFIEIMINTHEQNSLPRPSNNLIDLGHAFQKASKR